MENKKYDLEKAKEDCRRHEDALEEAQSCMCGHCHECGFDPAEMKAALDEVERLRSLNESLMENGNDLRTRCQKAEARIKELEEANRNIDKRRDEMAAFIERLEAAFLKAETLARSYTKVYPDAKLGGTVWYLAKTDAREELERIKEGRKDE